tara:strand:- start:248 stop:673 length:426 start_codon:yes stop_codon:yes gene_type:complete
MAFYGIGGGTIGTTSMVRGSWSEAHVYATSDWSNIVSNDLAPGMYALFFNFTPSPNSGDINNGDPDAWQIRILYDGNTISATPTAYEANPHLYQQTICISYVIGWTSGTKTITFQLRTTDPDAGGAKGGCYCTISRIMDYS